MKTNAMLAAVMIAAATIIGAQELPEPRKGDTVGWHEVRAGETLSGLTERYLGDSSLWPENHRLNPDVADPNRLTPGQRIRVILSREIAARSADIEQVSRRVEKKPRADDWTNARVGDQLVEREGLRTYPKSSAELGFDDGSNLVLTENSIVFLREYVSTIKRVDRSLIEVVDGGVDVAVTPKAKDKRGKDIEIVLGDVKAKPRAAGAETAKARAVKDESAVAKLSVYAGASEVESAGVKVQVAKGQGTSVKQGEAPAPPERLVAAPKLTSPGPGTSAETPVKVAWAGVAGAASYIVEVCRDEACGQLVERMTGVAGTSATVEGLPGGELYVRLTGRSGSGLDGYPSKPVKIHITRAIEGKISIDRAGTNDPAEFEPSSGALVRLFEDDGDGMPGAGDKALGDARTDETGRYRFPNAPDGTFWVAVDSRSASPAGAWVEQVAGPAGSLCADGAGGTTARTDAGACYGGRRAGASDDFASLDSAEHVAKVVFGAGSAAGALDFVFSPSVVTTTADADEAPQGSLRRFLANAASIAGDDAMRFVPMEPANGKDDKWWTISLTSALQPVDDVVTVDGAAWSADGKRRDTNEGDVVESTVVGAEGASLAVAERPELEIDASKAGRALLVRDGTLRVRHLSVFGSQEADVTSVGRLEMEHCVVGAGAGLDAPQTAAPIAIDVSGSGSADVSTSFVRAGGSFGVYVRSDTAGAKVTARDLAIANCATGAAVRIESNGSTFERTHVSPCGETPAPLAFELKGTKSTDNQTCRMNRIAASTIAGHGIGVKIRVGAMDNVVERTLFERVTDGVELDFVMGFWVPKGNRISRNVWREFEEPIALTGMQGVTGVRFFEGAQSCADGGWVVDRALDFPGRVSLAKKDGRLEVSAVGCPDVEIEGYLESNGTLQYLATVKSDSSGNASGSVELPPGATRVGVLAIDRWSTTSRMSLHEVE